MQRIANPLKQRGMELVGMQRIANPLRQRGMERIGMQRIANPLKQCGMELVGMQRIANPLKQREMELAGMQRIANPLKQCGNPLKLQEMKEKPFADYPFLHPPGADKHSFLLFPIMPQLLPPQTIA